MHVILLGIIVILLRREYVLQKHGALDIIIKYGLNL